MPQTEYVESVFDGICDDPIDCTIKLVKEYKRSNELIPKLKQVVKWYESTNQDKIKRVSVKPKEISLSAEELTKEIKELSVHTRRSILEEAINKRLAKVDVYFRLSVVLGDFQQMETRVSYKAQYIKSYQQSTSYDFNNLISNDKCISGILNEAIQFDNVFINELINQRLQYQTEKIFNMQKRELKKSLARKLRSNQEELRRKRKKRMFLIDDNVEQLKEIIAKYPLSEQRIRNEQIQKNDSIKIFGKWKRIIEEAARYGAIKCFKFLLMNGVKVNEKTLESAFVSGNLEIIQLVREEGIEFTEKCLKNGIKYHHNELVKQLIEDGSIGKINMTVIIEEAHKHNNLTLLLFMKEKGFLNEIFYQSRSQHHMISQQQNISVRAPIAHYVFETFKSTCNLSDQIQIIQDDDPLYSAFLISTFRYRDLLIKNDSIELFSTLFHDSPSISDYLNIIQYHSIKILQYQSNHDSSFAANVSTLLSLNQPLFKNHRDSSVIEILLNAGGDKKELFIGAADAESSKPLEFMLSIPKPRENAPHDLLVRAVKHSKLIDKIIDLGFETKGAFREAVKSLNILSVIKLVARKIVDFNEFDSRTYNALIHEEAMIKYLLSIGWNINQPDNEGKTLLIHSLWRADYLCNENKTDIASFIEFLLKSGADINYLDHSLFSPISIAIEKRNEQLVNLLIEHEANINVVDKGGNTPLHLAIQRRMRDIVELLIKKGVNVNTVNNEGNSPLHLARDKYIAKLLIEKGADINAIDNEGNTPLFIAINHYKDDIAELLIENGANVNVIDKNGNSLLHLSRDKKISKLLIEKGADVNIINKEGYSSLHLAIKHFKDDIAELLIEKGADVNIVDRDGNSMLHLTRDKKIAKLLVKKGADINAIDNEGNTPLIIAINHYKDDIAEHLIEKGANVNVINNEGNSPLHIVRDEMIAGLLIEKGANINAIDREGNNPLHLAINRYHRDIAALLIEKGINVNVINNEGNSPLHLVRDKTIAELLIAKGADVNIINKEGNNPLHLAIKHYKDDIAELLIEKGADVNIVDRDGNSPLTLATQKGLKDVVKLLSKKDPNST